MKVTRVAGLSLLAAAASASCAAPPPSVGATTSVVPAPTASASSPQPSSSTPAVSSGVVAVDQALLDALPDAVDGQPIGPDAETAAGIAATEALAIDIQAIGVGLYIRPGTSRADDLAIASIVRVRDDVFDEEWFRSWRATYDHGACEVAGGVSPGGAQRRIGEHETYIGACEGGVNTYHVHLEDPDRIVSITAAGEARFGERVVAGLTE